MGYIYETTNLKNGKKYIGLTNRDSFDENYLGSGKLIRAAIKKYGFDNFHVQPLEYHYNKDDLIAAEKRIIKERKANTSSEYYNIAEGGKWGNVFEGMSDEQYKEVGKKISKKRKEYFINNPEKRVEYSNRMKDMRKKNPLSDETIAKRNESVAKWREKNPDKVKERALKGLETKKANGNTNPWINRQHPWIGRSHKKETRQKISESLKGYKKVTPCSIMYKNTEILCFLNVADLREFLKKELKWKKKEYIKISEDRQVFGYYIKKYKSRVIKPQTTIEK